MFNPMVYRLFILKTSLRSFALSLTLSAIVSFIYLCDNCEAILSIMQIVQSHLARCRAKKHYASCTSHTALEHYSGGCPVPRAQSYYNGDLQIYAIILVSVGFFSPLFAFLFYSNNQIAGLS
jgi:hypothetical protein